ncbi:MAG TPA: AAA family ATPase [Candidatus Bathyarchaeia archaeon]|nr:AAA family ATPase [Candidatus Bathyarchaeia archaeon]
MSQPKIFKKILNKFKRDNAYVLTEEHKKCLEILENTNQNLFIIGKAGTGKSMLIQYFRNQTKKKVVVLAPTGIAALNIRGQTIHSFFGFPPRLIEPKAIRRTGKRIFADLDCLVIDEISMVRADLFDGVDRFLRLNGRDERLPFGGIQVVIVGDLYQLPPVITYQDISTYSQLYDSPYFFSANSFELDDFNVIELKTIFRQKELHFIEFLNQVRSGDVSADTFSLINQRVTAKQPPGSHIVLCTVNKTAEAINQRKLDKIKKPLFVYQAAIEGDFPTENRNLPVDLELKLKKGARVLFVKNDPGRRWVNGTLGKVDELAEDLIEVKINETKKIVAVDINEWDNIEYEYNQETGGLVEKVIGKLKQYPLRLAWAITVHKSQGMSLDKVCVDFSRSPFAHGQTYVALSRCRSLEGIILTKRIWRNDILIDERITEFHKRLLRQIVHY